MRKLLDKFINVQINGYLYQKKKIILKIDVKKYIYSGNEN